jgi:monovalent cation/hydrogen antiporter
MQSVAIHNAELVFLLLLFFVAALAAVAKRLHTPYPIILVVGGLILGFIPHAPRIELNPDIVFLVVIPPLVFSAAFLTSWRDFRYNLISISMLAFGLVGFTVFGVAAACRWILPGFDWRLGLVLGAVVSTTDTIAAAAIAKRVGLPKRIVDVIEGESLVNDATGLLALEFTVGLVVTGHHPGIVEGAGRLLYLVLASIAIGLVIGKLMQFFESRIEDASIEVTLSLLAPYLAYLSAEGIHSSGVLSTVACGLYLGNRSSFYFSRAARLRAEAVWDTLTFVLNGVVFILIGLQLPYVMSEISGAHLQHFMWIGALFSAVVILLRTLWVFPGARIANLLRRRFLQQPEPLPSSRAVFVVAWTGMRGVIALAAAMSLPKILADGSTFPHRSLIVFLTFSVIFVTLVLQGLTLPPLIRRLGLAGANAKNPEEERARREMAEAALAYLEHAREHDAPEANPVYEELIRFQRRRLDLLNEQPADGAYSREEFKRFRDLAGQVRSVQRAALLHMRNENHINDEVMRKLERELDIVEARFATSEYL